MPSTNFSISDALQFSLVGFATVIAILAIILVVIKIMQSLLGRGNKAESEPVAVSPAQAAPVAAASQDNSGKVPAPGSIGEIKLNGVPEKTAAMIMAIVADEMQTPLNELRFISIKQLD